MRNTNSERLFRQSTGVIPGGVNSPVRAFGAVGGTPPAIARGAGSRIFDVDGNEYIDFVCSWGPLALGHAHERVIEAVKAAAMRGTSFGAPTEGELKLAELITSSYPGMDKVRLVNSGTEAAMSALRLARGFTGRDLVVKFAGCYHGHGDSLLARAGSGVMTLSIPSTPGVPECLAALTAVLPYNDSEAARAFMEARGSEVAAVIVEPVAANMGVIPPADGFLETLRQLTAQVGALLIFDEVITGFRLAPGGAAEKYGITPDIAVLGKIIGGGLPVGAYGGTAEIMDHMAPGGPVYQAGTLSGNPIATAAGLATLEELAGPGAYETLENNGAALQAGLEDAFDKSGIAAHVSRVGSIMTAFFCAGPVTDYESAAASDTRAYAKFFHGMLASGVYLAPSQFEAAFVSIAHSKDDLEQAASAAAKVLSGAEFQRDGRSR